MNLEAYRPPLAVRLLLGLALANLGLHFLSNGPLAWGYMTDELYFLDSLHRLDWGFVDHPPLSIALLAALHPLLGDSIFGLRLPAVFASAATVFVSGLMAREMGGGRAAQGLSALSILVAPVHLAMGGYYSMNPIDHALWATAAWLLLRLLNGADQRLWLVLGVGVGLGLLNKVSMSWFAFGLGASLLLTPQRRWLLAPWPWAAGAIAAAMFAPFLWWQWRHGWPFLEFSLGAAELKVGEVSPSDFFLQQVLGLQPLAAPLWIGGLVYGLAARELRPYRLLAWIFLAVFALLAFSGSARPHYLAPAFPIAVALGAVGAERLGRSRRWLLPSAAAALAIAGAISAPIAIPLLSPAATIRFMDAADLDPPQERERGGELPMHLGLYLHAEAGLAALGRAYASLSPEEQERVTVVTRSFGEAGAVNVLGTKRGLPRSVGVHNQYWLWGPGEWDGELVLLTHDDEVQLGQWFESCERRGEIECSHCMEIFDAQALYLCRHARLPLAEIWQQMKIYR